MALKKDMESQYIILICFLVGKKKILICFHPTASTKNIKEHNQINMKKRLQGKIKEA